MVTVMKTTRPYTQSTRAEATARTRARILDATFALAQEKLSLEIVLTDVAERAGVSVQTILRHFGTRDGLFDAAREHGTSEVVEERDTPVGDAGAAVTVIVAHYERRGTFVLSLLAQARFDEDVATVVRDGVAVHRRWVATTFAPQLATSADPAELLDLLVVATDIGTWSLLRHGAGHDRDTTTSRMHALVSALLVSPKGRL